MGSRCLGRFSRLCGQNLSPRPPAMITTNLFFILQISHAPKRGNCEDKIAFHTMNEQILDQSEANPHTACQFRIVSVLNLAFYLYQA